MKKYFLLLAASAIFQTSFAQKQILGFHLQPGETYNFLQQSSTNVNEDVNGQKVNVDITLSGKTSFKIIDLKDSVYDMDVRYEKIAMTMKLPTGDVTFNSDKRGDSDILSSVLSTLIGKPFLIRMTEAGKIIEVKNVDAVFGSMFDKFPKLTAEQKEQIQTQLKQSYGEKAIKGSFEMITSIYSTQAVDKGDTWTLKTRLESAMDATLVTIFELKDKQGNYNIITGNGKLQTVDNDTYKDVSGMPTKYDLSGTMTSTLKVDNKTGWIMEATVNQKMEGSADIKDNP
ncbi:MAG: DUF6263 family protein, partial [Ferruginibacter sp.]